MSLCEIRGGYLIWQFLKVDKLIWYGIAGGVILAAYGVIATWQSASFGRVYASYGGIFFVLSLLWAWKVDHFDQLADFTKTERQCCDYFDFSLTTKGDGSATWLNITGPKAARQFITADLGL